MTRIPELYIPNPTVYEQTPRGERYSDVYSRLLRDNIVFLGTPIDDTVANLIIAQLLFLEAEDPEKDINLYINSPGGSITAGMAIYDTMQFIRPEVVTICLGQCASMGALLLTAGTKGKRFALPNSRILIHQPSIAGGIGGQASDIKIQAEEIIRMRELTSSRSSATWSATASCPRRRPRSTASSTRSSRTASRARVGELEGARAGALA